MAQVQCEISIIRLTNLDVDLPAGNLFIRYYVYAGCGRRRIRIDTREISCTRDPYWDEKSSLECSVPSQSTKEVICASNVMFELRWRRTKQVFGMVAKSKLLGRAEVSWEDVLGSVERRVSFVMNKSLTGGLKPPALVVKMGIRVRALRGMEKREGKHEMGWNECRCESCGWIGSEEDMFLAATAGSVIDAW